MRNYTRWTRRGGSLLQADILGAPYTLVADPQVGMVRLVVRTTPEGLLEQTPDEARMLGVRLIEAAALADGERAIRDASAVST